MGGADPRIAQLQGTALFGGVSEATAALVLERAHPVTVASGDWFFREGEGGSSIYWLGSGRVAVLKARGGEDVELRRLDAGACFGEVALFDLGPRSASVRALADCEALELRPRLWRELRERDLEQYALLTQNLGRELSRRLRALTERLFGLGEGWDADGPPPST